MHIEALKVFCDLAETGSFTNAAHLNSVTQSAVSQSVAALERQFQCLLSERKDKKFCLTREGQMLYDGSKEILVAYEALFREVKKAQETADGNIRISAITSIGLYDLPRYLKTFIQACPAVDLRVKYGHTDQVYEAVRCGDADFGLVAFPDRRFNLEITPLRKEPMVLICHPQHPLAMAGSVRVRELHRQKFIYFAPDPRTRRAVERVLVAAKATVQVVMELDSIETVKRAVEIDAGVAVVPKPTVALEVANKILVEVPLEGQTLFRPLAAIHRTKRGLSHASIQFLAILKGEKTVRTEKPEPVRPRGW